MKDGFHGGAIEGRAAIKSREVCAARSFDRTEPGIAMWAWIELAATIGFWMDPMNDLTFRPGHYVHQIGKAGGRSRHDRE